MFQICRPTQTDYQVLTRDPPPPIKKYWNYVLHYVLSPSLRYWKGTLRTSPPQVLELCMALLCHPSWVPRTRTLHPHPHKYYNCVLYYVFFLPFLANWPTSPSPVKYYRHVLELCIVLGLTIIAFSVETQQHNYLLSVGISYQPSPRLDILCFETYII